MFSKSKINEKSTEIEKTYSGGVGVQADTLNPSSTSKIKASPSTLSSDLTITGNLKTTGDIQVEGKVEGDIRAHLLTIGETALIKGEVIADDVVVNGRVVGKIRGLKVRLTTTARVEGDIIHKTIAIESVAHFEGSVQRQEDPLNSTSATKRQEDPLNSSSATKKISEP